MKFIVFTISYLLLRLPVLNAQAEGNLWFCCTNSVVDFSGARPVLAIPPPSQPNIWINSFPGLWPETEGAAMSVSDAGGNLLFFVKVQNMPNNGILGPLYPAMPKIFSRNGYSMPNSDINANWENPSEYPLIVPHPGNKLLYYVFYTRNGSLQYAIVDMSLNNGLGDVAPGQKDVALTGEGTISGTKLTTVRGCNGTWLVLRSHIANQYLSYRIDREGLHTTPVISECGQWPINDYNVVAIADGINWRVGYPGGRLVASTDGTQLAAGCRRGIELYDFEQCSGMVKNPRTIDTLPFFGLCFSPDGSRLYASQIYPLPHYGQQGQVYQFDMTQKRPDAITASKTLILSNEVMACYNPILGCYCDTMSSHITDLRLGPDGKIYMSNTKRYCAANVPVYPPTPPTTYHALHVIHNPDNLGLACNPEMEYLRLNTPFFMTNGGDYAKRLSYLPHTLHGPAATVDTLRGNTYLKHACFAETFPLQAPENSSCIQWDDGSTERERVVSQPGTYWLNYYNACTYTTDTFKVQFISLPLLSEWYYACPGSGQIVVQQPQESTLTYNYTLYADSMLIATALSSKGYRFHNLDTGKYLLHISTEHCDTLLTISIMGLPLPEVITEPVDTLIAYGDTIQLQASGAVYYLWEPELWLSDVTIAHPLAWPRRQARFRVIGRNEYGCYDTAFVNVRIDYTMPDLVPNAFSPNGDGLNDVFRVAGLSYQKVTFFQVYNRYGQALYQSDNENPAWDGTFKGQPCDAGTYYYHIGLSYPDGSVKVLKGDLLLLR